MMQPRAVLVLYQPGHKFKNYKYLLSLGANVVGNDPKCQVFINSKQYFPQDYVANFLVTDDFMYIEALCEDMVQFKSNMVVESSGRKKDVFRYIEKNCRYVVPMEEIFYIGPYKGIVQVQAPHELRLIKNVLNIENFSQTPRGDQEVEVDGEKQEKVARRHSQSQKIQVDEDVHMDAQSDGTQKIDSQSDYAFAPTLEIDDNDPYAYEPTLLIQDEKPHLLKINSSSQNNNLSLRYPYEPKSQSKSQPKSPLRSPLRSPYKSPLRSPRINPINQANSQQSHTKSLMKKPHPNSQLSDISMFSRQKQKKSQHFSQEILYETIKKDQNQKNKQKSKSKQEDEEDDVSMPDTIKDSQEEKQPDLDDDFEMPPTIKDDDEMPPTIKDDEIPQNYLHKNDNHENDEMPPTINDDDNLLEYQPEKQKVAKVSKTMHQKKPINPSLNKHLYKSEKHVNKYFDDESDDILGLFRHSQAIRKIDSGQIEINDEKRQIKQKKQDKKKKLVDSSDFDFKNRRVLDVNMQDYNTSNNMIKSNGSVNLEKENKESKEKQTVQKKTVSPSPLNENSVSPNFAKKRLFKESQKPKLVNLAGLKPKAQEKLTLRQRGYQIVPEGQSQDYELMIYDRSTPVTPKFLMAILLDKQIVTEDWLRDKNWEQKKGTRLQGTIQGISWQIVHKQRGKRDIFENAGTFYFTPALQDLAKVFEYTGGTRSDELNKRKKMSCVINCEMDEHQKFYREYLNCRNWKFYSHKLIVQSILLGQILFKKYIVDETSF